MEYSLGVDLGTTTVAAILTGGGKNVFPAKSLLNFQYPEFGLDSVKRIQNGLDKNSVKKLQEGAVSTINALIDSYKNEIGFNYGETGDIQCR